MRRQEVSGAKLERFYNPHTPVHYIQCQCSTAHTFGNVTAYIQNWLLKLFPENLFKTIHINSKIAHAQIRSTPKEFLKKEPPFFIVRPRIDWNDTNKFLAGTPIIQRQGDLYNTYGMTNLMEFIRDDKNKLAIKYQLNRHVMYFDIVLIFNTYMQQINWVNYLQNAVRNNIPFNLDTMLEGYLSPELLKALSDLSGVPMIGNDGTNIDFLAYLNSNSGYPITHKLQGSSGTDEYYRYYPTKLDCMISDLSTDEGSKSGQIADRYSVSFTMRTEFYGTGFYYLFSDKIKERAVLNVDTNPSSSATIIPIFTDVLTELELNLPEHWRLYAQPICKLLEKNEVVEIESLFNTSLKACFEYHLKRKMPLSNFFKLIVRRQGQLMVEGKEYVFDPIKKTVRFINCDTYYTYKIILTINLQYINELIKDIYGLI